MVVKQTTLASQAWPTAVAMSMHSSSTTSIQLFKYVLFSPRERVVCSFTRSLAGPDDLRRPLDPACKLACRVPVFVQRRQRPRLYWTHRLVNCDRGWLQSIRRHARATATRSMALALARRSVSPLVHDDAANIDRSQRRQRRVESPTIRSRLSSAGPFAPAA